MEVLFSSCAVPLRHISSGQLLNEGGFLHARRKLDTFVLLVGSQGTVYLEQDGEPYELKPNRFLLLFPGREHAGTRPSEGRVSYYWCHFQVAGDEYELAGEQEARQYLYLLQNDANRALSDRYIVPEHGEMTAGDKTEMLFRQLLDLAEGRYSDYMAHYALSLIMMELSSGFVASHVAQEADRGNSRIAEIMEWVRIHYNDDLSVGRIAEAFGYNPNYLSGAFKSQTGLSLLRYINRTRINMAKRLLLGTSDSIRVIAERVGFQDEKHFMKLFKQMENITPGKYRNAFCHRHMNRE